MVRLRLLAIIVFLTRCYSFQFHDGSIEAFLQVRALSLICIFQFHDGSIEAGICWDAVVVPSPFQFHDGSIEAA